MGGQKRLEKGIFDQRSIEVRKLTMGISGERAFQAEEETSAKVLKHLHIQRRRPTSEVKEVEKGDEAGTHITQVTAYNLDFMF